MLHKTQQPITDPLLTPEEMASLQAMSLEEVRLHPAGPWLWGRLPWPQPSECAPHPSFQAPIPHPIFLVLTPCSPSLTPSSHPSPRAPWQARRRRAELQKARAVQSYYEAKARRAKRIKSKK